MNVRHLRMLLTALGMMTLGAMEMYVPSVAKTSDRARIDVGAFKSGGMDANESFTYKCGKPRKYHFALDSSAHGRNDSSSVIL